MLKNRKDHYVPDFDHHKHNQIKNYGGYETDETLIDEVPTDIGKKRIEDVTKWIMKQSEIKGALLIGSYARGEERDDSDIDLVLFVDDIQKWVEQNIWVKEFGTVISMTVETFEEVVALRIYYQDNCEIEFGFTTTDWLNKPYVASTQEALDGGYKVLTNPMHLLDKL